MKLLVKILLLVLAFVFLPNALLAQDTKIDIDALVTETQKQSPGTDEMTLVWWIPTEFWQATLAQEKLAQAQIQEFLGLMRPYTVIVVVDGNISSAGKISYRAEASIRSGLRIVDSQKREHLPLPSSKVGPGMNELLKIFRPIIANALGPLGANMHFVVFPSQDTAGQQIGDARIPGTFTVKLQENRVFTWRLPLASLVPPKLCPVDGEKLNATFKFCPFHGNELKK